MTGDEFMDRARRDGALVSGKKVADDFTEGWGHPPFLRGMKAHHWTADRSIQLENGAYGLRSACGILSAATARVPLLGPGNLPFCARCESRLMAKQKDAVRRLLKK